MNTNSQQLETIDIPLSKLLIWEGNVRIQTSETGIKELAASIASVGLLQSIVVQKAPKGKYSVIAGRRRLLALSLLMDDGKLSGRFPVPCRLAATDSDLTEISLAENVFHEPMSIIQEILAFRRWVQEGKSATDIAVRFGTSEAVVNRRLALADVSPVLLEKCEAGEISLAILQAFTLTSDHAAQEALWEQLPRWDRKPETIRALLSRGDVPAADQRVRFVGLDAYEAEGGTVLRDLFAEGEDGTWICDRALLQRLVAAKLETVAAGIEAEGWKWVAIELNATHQFLAQFRRMAPMPVPMSAATLKKLAKLEEKAAQLQEEIDAQEDDDVRELIAKLTEAEDASEAIRAKHVGTYDAEARAKSGVIITIGNDGQPEFICGLLRKQDIAVLQTDASADEAEAPTGETNSSPTAAADAEDSASGYSAALIESLTTHKTAAIAAELAQNPRIALAAVVHAQVLSQIGMSLNVYRHSTCLGMSAHVTSLSQAADSPAFASLEKREQDWLRELPHEADQLWQWMLTRDQDTLLRLLAHCAASSVNAIERKQDQDGPGRLIHADQLANALGMDMTKWFTPTADNFFARVSKPQILAALTEAGKTAPDASKLKKAELASQAAAAIQGTGWLPAPVRIKRPTENPHTKEGGAQ
jgi:ParB family chromosome partitioning protein